MKVIICDETLRKNLTSKELEMSFKEKLEIARHLDDLKVDIIGVGPVDDPKTDSVLFRTISTFIKNSKISCSANATKESIDLAYDVIKNSKDGIIAIEFPSTVMQMEYLYHKKPEKMLETIKELISYAKNLNVKVEAIFLDATRAEEKYLYDAINAASEADYVSVMDSAGIALPNEFSAFVKNIKKNTKTNKLGIGCSNALSLASACVISSINDVDFVKTTVLGKELPRLGNICTIIKTIGNKNKLEMNVDATKVIDLIDTIRNGHDLNKESITKNETVSDIKLLDKNVKEEELNEIIKTLGYDLSVNDQNAVYETFLNTVNKKAQIKLKELDVIIANVAMQVPQTYKLDNFVINSGNKIKSTSTITLYKGKEELFGIAYGDGPIDASFKAIEQIIGRSFELDDFKIKSTTEGAESMGEALIKLRYNGKLYSGNGVSTDINGASIRAYIQAVNKIVYDEENN